MAARRPPAWPPDHQTAVVVLTHDAKFDQPALEAALATDAFYIGALGSRRNQEKRRARLLEAGVAEEALERIAGPCGPDIGAETQEETGALDPRRDPSCAPGAPAASSATPSAASTRRKTRPHPSPAA